MLKVLNQNVFDDTFEILENSFPVSEFRTKDHQKALFLKKEYVLYGIYAKENESSLMGILAVWELDHFIFIEHFAIKKDVRGTGIGGEALVELQEMTRRDIVLEVELPENKMQERRISFYKKYGFCPNLFAYFQPPLREGMELLPLMLMSYPKPLAEKEFLEYKNILYDKVYGYVQ